MAKKILIMGLPTSGKTTFAGCLDILLRMKNKKVAWFNADQVRKKYDDWDFSEEGRIRQATRMTDLANNSISDYVICDFVAPLQKMRDIFNADYKIWLDTIEKSEYDDTNKIFEIPTDCDFILREKDSDKWAKIVLNFILKDKTK